MEVDKVSGLLKGITYCASPNCDKRPVATNIDLLVIHGICLPPEKFGGPYIQQLFTNQLDIHAHPYFKKLEDLKVSAHLLIRRDGEIVQFVPFHLRAWHAGESCFKTRTNCNDFSIGIELEGADSIPYESVQYETLAEVIKAIQLAFPMISRDHILGHSDIAPGRKTDPGPAFDWSRLFQFMDK